MATHFADRRVAWLSFTGVLLLLYAVLGNYVALPGYIRFLERGGRSDAGSGLDAAVVLGAAKTILWMYSFQLGVLALVVARSIRERLHTLPILAGALVWLTAWSVPSLPKPDPWFYIAFGGLVLASIFWLLRQPPFGAGGRHCAEARSGLRAASWLPGWSPARLAAWPGHSAATSSAAGW